MILAGDIGGTHTRLALFDPSGPLILHDQEKFRSREHNSLVEIIQTYLKERKKKIYAACFGLAGPIRNGRCQATNLPWIVELEEIKSKLGVEKVALLNDLEANAYGINVVDPSDLYLLHPGHKQEGNKALIAAGTGLGEAGIYWDGTKEYPFACEGGHVDFAPRNRDEIELLLYLKRKFSHVSYERVISGPGILAIYQFLIDTGREAANEKVQELMKVQDPPKVISEYGRSHRDKACMRAIDWFLSLYGAESGNLALKFLALGGFYIGGGIVPNLLEELKQGSFHAAFVDKGRFNHLLHSIPIYVILNDKAALLGAASFARGL